MATDFELALFEQELETVLELPDACRRDLERDKSVPLGVLVVMHPLSNPKELFKCRLRWGDYFKPVSMKFIDISTGTDTNPRAWPQCFGFRPGSFDACVPWTAEGHSLHPEWTSSGAFPNVRAPLQFALLHVQASLDNSYTGRSI